MISNPAAAVPLAPSSPYSFRPRPRQHEKDTAGRGALVLSRESTPMLFRALNGLPRTLWHTAFGPRESAAPLKGLSEHVTKLLLLLASRDAFLESRSIMPAA